MLRTVKRVKATSLNECPIKCSTSVVVLYVACFGVSFCVGFHLCCVFE